MRSLNWRGIVIAAMSVAVILLSIGCGGNGSPTIPGNPSTTTNYTADRTTDGNILWGYFDVEIDSVSGDANIVPLRGAMFNANVVKFLQPPLAPVNLLSISINPGTNFSSGYIDLDVTLSHPFPGLDKFRGFDVRGIVIGDGSWAPSFDSTAIMAGPGDLSLLNPDGYSRWWNPTEFTSYGTILGYTQGSKAPPAPGNAVFNAYKYFADDLSPQSPLTDLIPGNRGTFSVEKGSNTRNYILQFPFDQDGFPIFKFTYAIDASWALPSDEFAPEYPIEAYPPGANTPEAWWATIDSKKSTAWYVNEDAHGGSVNLDIEIFDWQSIYNPSGVMGEVAAIYADCDLFPSINELGSVAAIYPGGPVSSVYSVEISDPVLTSAGMFDLWIGVEADDPVNYAPQIEGDPSFFDWPDTPIRSIWHGIIDVSPFFPSDAPVVDAVNPTEGIISTVVPDLQIFGANFQSGVTVEFVQGGTDFLTVDNVQWVGANEIHCDVTCDGPLGLYDVTIKNPDTQEGSLFNGFEVVQPGDSIWWESQMYNSKNIGRNPTVPGADPNTLVEIWSQPVSGNKKYCTPVVADDKIFFTGNDGFYGNTSQTIYCYDLYTGELKWSNPINPSNYVATRAFACPVWWEGNDGIQRVAVGGDQVYCYNAETGEELWTFDDEVDGNPINWIANQMQKYNGMVLARSRQSNLYVLDFVTGSLVSKVNCSSSSEGGCGASDGLVYISSGKWVDCADIMTGEIQWSTQLLFDAGISHWVNPTIANDRVYISTYQGYVFALAEKAHESYFPGDIIWSWHDPLEPVGNNPLVGGTAVIGDKVFVAPAFSGNFVYCISDLGDSAETFWQSSTTGYFDASPVWSTAPSYPDGVVYCPDNNGFLRAWDAANGQEIWQVNTGGELRAGMTPILNLLVVTSATEVTVYTGS